MYWVYVHVWPSSPRRCVVPCWARWMQEAGRVGVDRGAGGRSGRSLSWEQQETKPLTCKNQHRHPYVRHSSLATEHALTQRTRFQFNLIRRLIIHVMRPHFSGFSWRYVVEDKWEQLGGETASSTLGWWERDRSALSEDESALIPLSLSLSMFLSLAPLGCTSSSHFIYFSELRFLPTAVTPFILTKQPNHTIISTYSSFNCSSSFTKAAKHISFGAKVALNAPKNLFVFEWWGP